MSSIITIAGENLIARMQGTGKTLVIDKMIIANIPDVDPSADINRSMQKPAAEHIVYQYDIPAEYKAYVNPNQVVYSAVLDSDLGDWDFNWLGLYSSAEDVVVAITTLPTLKKFKTAGQIQGNHLTRNIMLAYEGAAESTGMTVSADTWQLDFSARLSGIDGREQKSNRDIYGSSRFWKNAFKLSGDGQAYSLAAGIAYVEGIRIEQEQPISISAGHFPGSVWIDVALVPQGSDVQVEVVPVFGENFNDELKDGIQHYLVKVAEVDQNGTVTDCRRTEWVEPDLVTFLKTIVSTSRSMASSDLTDHNTDTQAHPDIRTVLDSKASASHRHTIANVIELQSNLDAKSDKGHTHTPAQVGLGNLPNAKSNSVKYDSSECLATSRAVKFTYDKAVDALNTANTKAPKSHRHTPVQVGLGNLPNAKSDGVGYDSSECLATSAAVKRAYDKAVEASDNAGLVELKASRSEKGTWTITGLKIGKPLFVLSDADSGNVDTFVEIATVSGAMDGRVPIDHTYYMLVSNTQSNATTRTTNAFIVIPTSTSVIFKIGDHSNNFILRAYQ
ncbi:phage tail protein [Maridesulfovibrio bastinii]|uniref:phage tail-collar fiber domain-containing protein n=1 Tax=Maridesulfovibrio bastinii TaxID=47157 RepID=UPI00041F772A|nr:phage tail protein [Maridesulfovibrio bastinii]